MTTPIEDHPAHPGGKVTLVLDHAVAILLLDLVGRMDDPNVEPVVETVDHPAERGALWMLQAELEGAVGEDLAADYDGALETARTTLLAQLEGK
ncbi:hypothetical protein [Aquabacter cavernae]|uniref:hypothetical protein n=1 Tax=Aquabacter cavernae TaxID=2496029 RepID=UPI000F8E5DB0|nr:hypothetical protein [Aquabacter cavernae]